MKYVYVGRIVNTHALKGEVRIISSFEYKERILKKGITLYIGQFKSPEVIETYRPHKQFDMVKFNGIDYINDVLKYKGANVYVDEETLSLNDEEILEEEFIGMEIINENKTIGLVEEYRNDNGNKVIKVNGKFIPYNKDFIDKVNKKERKIYMHDIGVFL